MTNGISTGTDTYSYDSSGRLTGINAASGVNLAYSYDGLLVNQLTWSGTIAGNVGLTYDDGLRRASESVNGADTITFSYDNDDLLIGAGDLTISRDPQTGFVTGSSLGAIVTAIGYTGFAEVASYSASANGSVIFNATYTRDKLGRITQKVETIGGVTSTYAYTYSTAGQLTGVSKDSVAIEAYDYDDNGNRTSTTLNGVTTGATFDDQDRVLAFGATTFNPNGAGDLESKTTSGQTTNYQYDQLGNLLSVTPPVGNAIAYVIDGRGRRVGKKVNNVLVKGFLYGDSLRPVAELDGADNVVSRFVYAESHAPIYMTKAGVTYQLIKDELGSVRLVVDTATGTIAQRIDYDSFGRVTLDTNPGFQPFGFAGGIYDPDTGLVRMGARDYDAITGRWTTKDPRGLAGNDTNFYKYAGNDPVNLSDPIGSSVWDAAVGFLQQSQVEIDTFVNPALGIQIAGDHLARWINESLGMPNYGPSLEDTIAGRAMPNPGIADYSSADYSKGAFVATCIGVVGGLATGVGLRSAGENPGGIVRALKGIGSAVKELVEKLFESEAPKANEIDRAAEKFLERLKTKGVNVDAANDVKGSEGWKTGSNNGRGSGRF